MLAAFERRIGAPIHTRFDLIAGTSAGGVIALGLAAGQSAAHVADLMDARGRAIFPPPWSGRMPGEQHDLRIDAVVSQAQAGVLKLDNASAEATRTLNTLAAHAARDALERPAVQLMLATRAPSV